VTPTSFLRGLVLGFSIAAPVGPIGVLCIRRTLAEGRVAGLLSGLGAASADAVYGSIAALGLTAVSAFLVSQGFYLRLVGGLFLCVLGARTLLTRQTPVSAQATTGGSAGAYASTFALTLTNPMTILAFAAMFAGLGFVGPGASYQEAAALVTGVFAGSMLWWITLTSAVGLLRDRITTRHMLWVDRISGLVIMAFGVFALSSLLR